MSDTQTPIKNRRNSYRRAEDLYRKAVEDVKDYAIFTTDPRGLVTSWNTGAERILGYDDSEILGRSAAVIFTPEDLAIGAFEDEMTTGIRNGCAEDERWHLRKDGRRFWASGVLTPAYDQTGKVFGFSKVLRDMTERRQLEEERDRFFTMSVDLLCIVYFDGSFSRVNPAFEVMLGYTNEELMSQKIFDLLHPDNRETLALEYDKLADGTPTNYMENRLRCKDGSYKWAAWSHFPDLQNQLAYGVGRDITEIKHLSEVLNLRADELEKANRVKDEFLATLSHELRTPLTSILGWSRLLQGGTLGPAEVTKAAQIIQRNSLTQSKLIEDLLDVSRIITGKLRFDFTTVALPDLTEMVINGMKPSLEAKHLTMDVDIDPLAGSIQGDSARIQQIISNLLSNAIKFTPDNGSIQVKLQRVECHLRLTISDSGIGIAPDVLPHIFERFTQADSSNARSYSGLGLGLAIVDALVRQHGGTVTASSEGTKRGSSFTVEFPMMAEEKTLAQSDLSQFVATAADKEFLDGLRVLLVEDDIDTRLLVKTTLEKVGALVVAVSSVRHAFEEIQQSIPDVIVSDIGMPEENGLDFIRRLRSLEPDERGRIPAIALTAYASTADRTRALVSGFQSHLTKPISSDELITTIASLVERTPDARPLVSH